MEAPARNLTVPLAAWLRRMGFTAAEHGGAWVDSVQAHWYAPDGCRFQPEYVYARATTGLGTIRLQLYPPSGNTCVLVADTTLHKLRQARFLLTANEAYAMRRKAALQAGVLQPASFH